MENSIILGLTYIGFPSAVRLSQLRRRVKINITIKIIYPIYSW